MLVPFALGNVRISPCVQRLSERILFRLTASVVNQGGSNRISELEFIGRDSSRENGINRGGGKDLDGFLQWMHINGLCLCI